MQRQAVITALRIAVRTTEESYWTAKLAEGLRHGKSCGSSTRPYSLAATQSFTPAASLQLLSKETRSSWDTLLVFLRQKRHRAYSRTPWKGQAPLCKFSWLFPAGQKSMAHWGLKLAVGAWWSCQPSFCWSLPARPASPAHLFDSSGRRRQSLILAYERLIEEFYTAMRGLYLLLLFLPVMLTAPVCVGMGWRRPAWVKLVRWTLERAGPAFIKWGQWAATRPDLFPPDVCHALARLHTGAPSHRAAFTRCTVENAFHKPLKELFDEFDEEPVASGSIAQIHRAVLSRKGAAGSRHEPGLVVAVKVRHPGVDTLMQRDFALMLRAAQLSKYLPVLSELRLDESVQQFGAPLKEQLDLAAEARHLARFSHNFRQWRNLSFPSPVFPLVTPEVLVETFEHGRLITAFVDNPLNPHNAALANIGRDCYLKMLLNDNFIHADLHPGNILVRVVDPNSLWGRVAHFFNLNTAPHLVLLDVGMTAELSAHDQSHIVAFFKAITAKDGSALAKNILTFDDNQKCPDPENFERDMMGMFDTLDPDTISEHTSDIIASMMELIRRHQVNLKGIVSTVVVTTLVLEGWSSKLNPDIKIMGALRDMLPMSWQDRMLLTVDRFMTSDPAMMTL